MYGTPSYSCILPHIYKSIYIYTDIYIYMIYIYDIYIYVQIYDIICLLQPSSTVNSHSHALSAAALGGLDEALSLAVLDAKGLAIRRDGLDRPSMMALEGPPASHGCFDGLEIVKKGRDLPVKFWPFGDLDWFRHQPMWIEASSCLNMQFHFERDSWNPV